MIESAEIDVPASDNWITVKDHGLFQRIIGAKTALLHTRDNTIFYKIIGGKNISTSHQPIELRKNEIDDYGIDENITIRDIRLKAPTGARVHVRISFPDRDGT